MRKLRFTFRDVEIENGVEVESFVDLSVIDNADGRKYAEENAYNGVITEYDDGEPDPVDTPTQLDAIEAQVTYTAMMTDTLLEV